MLTFLFWNLSGKRLLDSLVRLVALHQVDVLMLAECPLQPAELLLAFNKGGESEFHSVNSNCQAIEIYVRFPSQCFIPQWEDHRATIQRMALPDREEILLTAAHMPSKLRWSSESQSFEAVELARRIREVEEKVGHQRTVLVGDLNMNPFEPGMLAASGLHAVMTRQIAARRERVVQSQPYPYFYNPMWGHFGDATGTPAGTYYYSQAEHLCYFWNMFDQVLLRPDLLSNFQNDTLEILTTDGEVALTTRTGVPDSSRASDHLPILFRIDI